VVVELTRQGELRLEDGTLEFLLRRDLGVEENFPLFIPAISYPKNGKNIIIHLLEGYVFVSSSLSEEKYFRLENKFYIQQVMASKGPKGMRILNVIPDKEVRKMKDQLQGLVASEIKTGDWVQVIDGTYTTLEGEVVDVHGDDALVHFELRSIKIISQIPRVFLNLLEEATV